MHNLRSYMYNLKNLKKIKISKKQIKSGENRKMRKWAGKHLIKRIVFFQKKKRKRHSKLKGTLNISALEYTCYYVEEKVFIGEH